MRARARRQRRKAANALEPALTESRGQFLAGAHARAYVISILVTLNRQSLRPIGKGALHATAARMRVQWC